MRTGQAVHVNSKCSGLWVLNGLWGGIALVLTGDGFLDIKRQGMAWRWLTTPQPFPDPSRSGLSCGRQQGAPGQGSTAERA